MGRPTQRTKKRTKAKRTRNQQIPSTKVVPFRDDEIDAALVAAGLMRKGTGKLPASFWKTRRADIPLQAVVAAVRADRDQD